MTVNHAPKPCKIFYTFIFPTIDFHPRKIEERERNSKTGESSNHHFQASARALITHLSTGEGSDRTSKHRRVTPQHQRDRRTPSPPRSSPPKTDPPKTNLVLDPKLTYTVVRSIVLDRHHSRPPIYLSFPQPPDLMNFFCWVLFLLCLSADKFFLLGFVSQSRLPIY